MSKKHITYWDVEIYSIGELANYYTGEVSKIETTSVQGYVNTVYCIAKLIHRDCKGLIEYVIMPLHRGFENGPIEKPSMYELLTCIITQSGEGLEYFQNDDKFEDVYTITATGETMALYAWAKEQDRDY